MTTMRSSSRRPWIAYGRATDVAYMVYQPYATAVKDGYRDRGDVAANYASSKAFREWLEGLLIDPAIRGELVQQARALERGFQQLVTMQA